MPFVPFRAACALIVAMAAFAGATPAFGTEPVAALFVGNSFTFGRADPVMSYNNARVTDLTRPRPDLPHPNFTSTTGANPWEPHPWGGVPGIFKQLADQAGLAWGVSLSTRNAASLRGHFLNTANADWDLRGNIASRRWDVVFLQEQSDAALPPGRGANANLPQFSAYADKIERFIHVGTAENYREAYMHDAMYGSAAGCEAAGGTAASCGNNTLRRIPANPNASAATKVYRAVDQGVAKGSGFYDAAGVYTAPGCCEPMSLWWHDHLHASRYGTYLSALVLFGTATGLDPWNFGAGEQAAAGLGIAPGDAVTLQRIASARLLAAGFALTRMPCPQAQPGPSGSAACGSAP